MRHAGHASDRRKYVDHYDAHGQEHETKAKKAGAGPIGFFTRDALLMCFAHSRISLQDDARVLLAATAPVNWAIKTAF
jgi:hypothetical protein